MKKYLFVLVGFMLLVSSFIAGPVSVQGQTTSGSDSAELTDEQKLQQLEDELQAAAAELQKYPLSISLAKKVIQLKNKITQATIDLATEGCTSVFKDSVKRLDNDISQLEKKSCDQTQRIAFRGMCNPFLSNFQECENKEHGHGDHGGSHSGMSSSPKPKKCIAAATLNPIISQLQDISSELKSAQAVDTNNNGLPDFCDNNSK